MFVIQISLKQQDSVILTTVENGSLFLLTRILQWRIWNLHFPGRGQGCPSQSLQQALEMYLS